jgi:RNA polymerase sigma-70 factor (ECF subfamily)
MVSETLREALWVLQAQSGDREALEKLLRSVQPSLARLIGAIVGPSEADDVVQETLIRVYQKLGQLTTPQLFRPWAFRIAKRLALRHMKTQTRWLDETDAGQQLDDIPAAPAEIPNESLEELLRIGRVSPASRAVLVLHFQEGLSLQEVAAALELPLGTVKSRLGYGLLLLRKSLRTTGSQR